MSPKAIIDAIAETAAENGGRPLGEKAFYRTCSITRTDLWNAGFARYSEAVEAAGLKPNRMQTALDKSEMLNALAVAVRSLGRFPTVGDLKVVRASQQDLPSYEAFRRISGGFYKNLPSVLLDHCTANEAFGDVAEILHASGALPIADRHGTARAGDRTTGYVYLAKHGRDFKIGRSNDVARRRREVALVLPEELKHVHIIETDDPEGIERYWHRRFESRRVRGEWFRLSRSDVAAFKRRRYQ